MTASSHTTLLRSAPYCAAATLLLVLPITLLLTEPAVWGSAN